MLLLVAAVVAVIITRSAALAGLRMLLLVLLLLLLLLLLRMLWSSFDAKQHCVAVGAMILMDVMHKRWQHANVKQPQQPSCCIFKTPELVPVTTTEPHLSGQLFGSLARRSSIALMPRGRGPTR